MTNLYPRIRIPFNRFSISGAIFAAGFLAIAVNVQPVPTADAMPVFGPSERPDYSQNVVNTALQGEAEQERIRQLQCVSLTLWGESRLLPSATIPQ